MNATSSTAFFVSARYPTTAGPSLHDLALPFSSRPLLLLASLLLTYALSLAFYRLFLSPLAGLPGPWYAAVSDLWITTHTVRMQQCRVVQALFDTYGPIVRIGPNKVAFCDVGTMRGVYCVHKFDKSPYYKSLLTNNNDHAMTTLPHAEHALRKKSYAPHYTPANLALFQPELHDLALKLSDTLAPLVHSVDTLDLFRHLMVDVIACTVFGSRSGSLDNWARGVRDPLSVAVYDFPKRGIMRSAVPTWAWNLVCRIPNARFREVCNSDKIMAEFVENRLYEMRANMQAAKLGYSSSPAATTFPASVHAFPPQQVASHPNTHPNLEALGYRSEKSHLGNVQMGDETKMPLIQRLLTAKMGCVDQAGVERDIVSEAMGHLIAGVDTSSTTLAYMFWELSRRRDVLARLQAEIDDVMPDPRVVPDAGVLNRCAYLNAFVKEALRLYGAAPSLLERVVPSPSSPSRPLHSMASSRPASRPASRAASPTSRFPASSRNSSPTRPTPRFPSSRHSSPSRPTPRFPSSRSSSPSRAASPILSTAKHEEFDMMGYALPPGTVVSTQAWSVHRAEDVFPSAETFLPERWLVADDDMLLRMHQHLVPFGIGTRQCGGQNLAQLMLRVVLAVVVRGYEPRADVRETNGRSMEMRDAFVLFPAAKECKLTFVPRAQ